MKAAFYGRYSTDMQREASLDDQHRNCDRYAQREGWKITMRFQDAAISGSDRNRPQYQRMIAAAAAKEFDVLLVDDLSRLSRDEIEMKTVIRRFNFHGIRIIGVSDGFDSSSKGHKIQAGVRGLMNELYLDDLAEKTHRGLTGQALKGNNCGGRSYGYRHLPIEDKSKRDEFGRPAILAVRREIDPEQAKWVRWVFEKYAAGFTPRWIAAELNRLKVPPPAAAWNRKQDRVKGWAASAINGDPNTGTGILNNPLYRGLFIWNRSEWVKNPDTGRRSRTVRPESEWIKTPMPALRIVDDELWDAVQARRREVTEKSQAIRRALHANARTGAGPKYLFSGLLKCGVCGGNFVIVDGYRYGCACHKDRGGTVCGNDQKVARRLVEDKLLEGIKSQLFTEEAIELFVAETSRLLKEQQTDKNVLQQQLAEANKVIGNIMTAIKAGIITPTTKAELQKAEAERVELEKRLKLDQRVATVLPRAVDRYRELVCDLGTSTQREVAQARAQIKALLGGEIRLFPTPGGFLEAELAGDLAQLLVSSRKINVVAGEGFEPSTFGL